MEGRLAEQPRRPAVRFAGYSFSDRDEGRRSDLLGAFGYIRGFGCISSRVGLLLRELIVDRGISDGRLILGWKFRPVVSGVSLTGSTDAWEPLDRVEVWRLRVTARPPPASCPGSG